MSARMVDHLWQPRPTAGRPMHSASCWCWRDQPSPFAEQLDAAAAAAPPLELDEPQTIYLGTIGPGESRSIGLSSQGVWHEIEQQRAELRAELARPGPLARLRAWLAGGSTNRSEYGPEDDASQW